MRLYPCLVVYEISDTAALRSFKQRLGNWRPMMFDTAVLKLHVRVADQLGIAIVRGGCRIGEAIAWICSIDWWITTTGPPASS